MSLLTIPTAACCGKRSDEEDEINRLHCLRREEQIGFQEVPQDLLFVLCGWHSDATVRGNSANPMKDIVVLVPFRKLTRWEGLAVHGIIQLPSH